MVRAIEHRFFATCAKGVEDVLEKELQTLHVKSIKKSSAGVYFTADMSGCYKTNLWLRTATRVLLEVSRFKAGSPEELYDGAKSVPWGDHFRLNQTFAVFATVKDSVITHSGFAALKVKDAIADSFRVHYGRRPNVDPKDPDVRVFVRILKDECVVNIDTSGESLHKRGYRTEKGEAPLRETLAAAILLMAGYNGTVELHDFMCGSGTIPIEAALIATNVAPGIKRKNFGFQRLLSYNRRTWSSVLSDAESRRVHHIKKKIYASDISKKNVEIVKSNARRASIRDVINVSVSDFKDTYKQSDSGLIITNPPYGERLDAGKEEKLKALFKELGNTLKQRYTGYDAYILSGNPELTKVIGLKADQKAELFNGPIKCELLKYALYEGSN